MNDEESEGALFHLGSLVIHSYIKLYHPMRAKGNERYGKLGISGEELGLGRIRSCAYASVHCDH